MQIHPLVGKIINEVSKQKKEELVSQLYDLALLSQNMLKGSKLTDFVKRSVGLTGGESAAKSKIILQ